MSMRLPYSIIALVLTVLCTPLRAEDLAPPNQSETLDLLAREQFEELDRRFAAVQQSYKDAKISDEDLRAAFRVFYATDAALEPRYRAWVNHSPRSYVAHLARGIYYKKVGAERRGSKFISETSDEQLNGMEAANEIAAQEFNTSLELDERPLLTFLHSIDLRMDAGDKIGSRELMDRAVAIDPRNFIVREKYMGSLQTRWGGSVAEMKAFLGECRKAGLSSGHLKALEALALEDEGWAQQYQQRDTRAAVRAYRKAAKLNPATSCLPCGPLMQAADALLADEDFKGAVKLYSKVLSSDPNSISALDNRAFAELQLKQTKAALADLLHAGEQGDAYAQDLLGRMYLVGESIPQDRDRAIGWLKKAADQGYAPAKELLPLALDNTRTPLPMPGGPRF
jgi:tetratricopeptide (TPR) repeat protein